MTHEPHLSAAAATDVGRVRRVNEDAYLTGPRIALVADGMGGHARGDVASALAVDAFAELGDAGPLRPEDLVATVERANRAIVAEGAAHPDRAGMGTTLTGVALVTLADGPGTGGGRDWHWLVLNVGDSRVYRLTGGAVEQLTVDHSEVAELVAAGRLRPEEARHHPLRNIVTRALGTDPSPVADTWLIPVAEGDRFLVCSDGLTGELEDARIGELAAGAGSLQHLADLLVREAVAAGGRDNVTVVVVAAPSDIIGADTDPDGETTMTLPRTAFREWATDAGDGGRP